MVGIIDGEEKEVAVEYVRNTFLLNPTVDFPLNACSSILFPFVPFRRLGQLRVKQGREDVDDDVRGRRVDTSAVRTLLQLPQRQVYQAVVQEPTLSGGNLNKNDFFKKYQ